MKDRKTYRILTIIGACFLFAGMPVNRFYLGVLDGIWVRVFTLNYLFVGAWADLFYMDKTFDEAMSKRGFQNTGKRNGQGR